MVHTEGENDRVEVWKDIRDYEGLYQGSNLGRMRSLDRWVKSKSGSVRLCKGKILKLCTDKYGYLKVGLWKNNKVKTYYVHRLVAEVFLPNPNNYKEVNHKDENKLNNVVSNLEWCDAKYNSNYGTRNERMSKSLTNNIYTSREVDVYDLDMNFIETLPSSKECGRKYKVQHSNVRYCCNGGKWSDKTHTTWCKVNRVGNYIFRWHK